MATENVELMKQARESLVGKWGIAVGGCFLYVLMVIIIGSPKDIGPALQFIVGGPLLIGLSMFTLSLSRRQEVSIHQLFLGFNEFVRAFVAYFLMVLFILLWMLLLIVPGIVAGFAYSQTFFILAEDKNISARDALKKSKTMMYGHKKKLFYLTLRFFGWFLLCLMTLGVGLLWVLPYFYVTKAKFYDDIVGKSVQPETV